MELSLEFPSVRRWVSIGLLCGQGARAPREEAVVFWFPTRRRYWSAVGSLGVSTCSATVHYSKGRSLPTVRLTMYNVTQKWPVMKGMGQTISCIPAPLYLVLRGRYPQDRHRLAYTLKESQIPRENPQVAASCFRRGMPSSLPMLIVRRMGKDPSSAGGTCFQLQF